METSLLKWRQVPVKRRACIDQERQPESFATEYYRKTITSRYELIPQKTDGEKIGTAIAWPLAGDFIIRQWKCLY
jgi:hypothetical protein